MNLDEDDCITVIKFSSKSHIVEERKRPKQLRKKKDILGPCERGGTNFAPAI